MTSSLTCPDDAELLAIAAGEEPPAELQRHLDGCPRCGARLERYKAEVAAFREGAPAAPLESSALGSLSSERVPSNGRTDDSNLVVSPQPVEDQTTAPHLAETDLGFADEEGTSEEPALPAAIGRYLVIGRFARTGQAEVYRVVHPGLARDMVLKLAHRPVEPGVRHEIIKEARILADLKHPNLVQVFDLDFLDDRPYLVMEYIRGRSLDQIASEGRLKPRRAAALLAKVAAAAEYAHRHGIFHRDIKPKNILVDEHGEPKLIDFGMARLGHAWTEDPGRPGGTFAFMAPEQARVESPEDQQKVGPKSDVFALGAVLYFLLTDRAPFEGETWRQSWDRARRCDYDAAALNHPSIPAALRRVCLKAMAAEPADRIASASAFQKALERFLLGPAVRAVTAGVAGLALLATVIAAASWVIPKANSDEAISLHVIRDNSLFTEYQRALPLRTGDRLKICCQLPRVAKAVVFWVDSEGGVKELTPVGFRRDEGGDHILYPEQGVARFEGPPGTELVVVCANRWAQSVPAEAATALAGLGRLPELPGNARFQISRDSTRLLAERSLGPHEADQLDAIMDRIERLRLRLRNQFDVVEGLVVCHQNAN
jgi:predicted Ser/Thr protein kinase